MKDEDVIPFYIRMIEASGWTVEQLPDGKFKARPPTRTLTTLDELAKLYKELEDAEAKGLADV